mgnify:CR=1 FL=1
MPINLNPNFSKEDNIKAFLMTCKLLGIEPHQKLGKQCPFWRMKIVSHTLGKEYEISEGHMQTCNYCRYAELGVLEIAKAYEERTKADMGSDR